MGKLAEITLCVFEEGVYSAAGCSQAACGHCFTHNFIKPPQFDNKKYHFEDINHDINRDIPRCYACDLRRAERSIQELERPSLPDEQPLPEVKEILEGFRENYKMEGTEESWNSMKESEKTIRYLRKMQANMRKDHILSKFEAIWGADFQQGQHLDREKSEVYELP
ncbi:hypothetical protein GLAREA_05234 [Glarea lozoyensis ATCC 20868]|uniref:Uncharacterized protein n=1 Tax=Glarea lozoyensis (strain ATCC 20868 / MF5171) TaxID=1116229 RepID=S3DVD3_GLAL2|nr:uncharacterized protein GLAREA_05234 [Glarea lozoyensis ATCC 20868]EPE35896.1 hypothetical protein GLAREA_05234 [Glarea lozoyensis ATCC 20868]